MLLPGSWKKAETFTSRQIARIPAFHTKKAATWSANRVKYGTRSGPGYEKSRLFARTSCHFFSSAGTNTLSSITEMNEDEPCGYCRPEIFFETAAERIEHETTCHQPWACAECNLCFATAPALEEHQTAHKMFRCEECPYKCKTKTMLKQHVGTHATEKKFKCEKCFKLFLTEEYRRKHVRLHMREAENKFPCTKCVRMLRTRAGLLHHMKKVHEDKVAFDCEMCGKVFAEKSYLRKHARTHEKDQQIECVKCHVYLSNLWQLRLHKKAEHKHATDAVSDS